MKNLKRIFSLALAGTMLAGMLTVGASAVTFTDAEDIKNNDAVNFMVALNIINGKDDGSFDPEATVTRAEMAKMITIALNGGREPVLGTKTTPTYTDIKGNWAEKYIEYCSNLGIIGGRGNGTFDPAGTVTGTEAAKMMLVAMGYDSTVFNFTGADWAINVNTEANNATPNKLYKGLESIDPNAGLSRDNAAQLIYNGVQDHIMVRSSSLTITNGEITYGYSKADEVGNEKTILTEKYGYAVKYGYLTGTSFNEDKDEYSYTIANTSVVGPNIDAADGGVNVTLKAEADYSDLYGRKVKVVYNSDNEAMGIYAANGSEILAEGAWGKASEADDGKSVKFGGTTYKYENASIPKLSFNTNTTVGSMNREYTFKAIDNDDNGKVDVIVVLPVTVAKVSYVGKESITAGSAYKFSENDIYEDVKKDDIVMIVNKANTANDTNVITKIEKVEGTVDAIRTGEYRLDGTWYKTMTATAPTGSDISTVTVGDEVEFYLINGFIGYAKLVSESSTLESLVYVVAVDEDATENGPSHKNLGGTVVGDDTLLLFADGTKKTVKAMRVDTHSTSATGDKVNVVPAKGLYTYRVNKDNIYELRAVKDAHAAGADASNKAGTYFVDRAKNLPGGTAVAGSQNGWDKTTTKKLAGKFVADDAIIFLDLTTTDKESQKVITGKELKAAGDWGDDSSCTIITKAVSGLDTVTVAVLVDDDATEMPVGDDGTGYGYVVSKGYAVKDADGKFVVKFTVWNGEDNVELTATDKTDANVGDDEFKAGAFVSYKKSTTAGEVTGVTTTGMNEKAITGYDGKNIAFGGADAADTLKDDNKTVVIYVNSDKTEGVEGGEIALAEELANGSFVTNAVAKITSNKVDVLFVDVNNKLAGAKYTITHDTAAVNGTNVKVAADATVTYGSSPATTVNTGDQVKAGTTVKVTLANNSSTEVAADAGETITVTVNLADGSDIVRTIKVNKGETFTGGYVEFEMPSQNVLSIDVTVA